MRETRFKQTEIGLIPEDWEVCNIGQVCKISTGCRNTQDKKDDGIYPFYVRSEQIERIDTYSYDCEAVLTAGDGVGTGKVFHYVKGKFELHQRVYIMNSFADELYGKYFYWYFSNKFFDRVLSMTAKSSVDSVRKEMIEDMIIPLPSISEQQHIATALSDIDALISALDKKIEKKKLIKQGAMQQLLTGKKRLPGFKEPWVEKKLGKLCDLFGRIGYRGYTKTDLVQQGEGAISFSPSDIISDKINYDTCTYISAYKYEESPEIKVYNGDIIFCKTASIGKCALVENLKEKATINPQFVVMKNFICNNKFLYYRLIDADFQNKVKEIAGGSTIPTMSQEKLKEQILLMPSDIVEQTAIAEIFTDMDKEITDLEAKRTKYEQIKYGMMQQLLTGKIRLINK